MANEHLEATLGVTDADAFWGKVKTNIAADRIRLVFVADAIADELASIVEFLNRQMTETEVIAIEVKQYVDDDGDHQTIVPKQVGRTQAARATKGPRSTRPAALAAQIQGRPGTGTKGSDVSPTTLDSIPNSVPPPFCGDSQETRPSSKSVSTTGPRMTAP